jgi:hypothetical protein
MPSPTAVALVGVCPHCGESVEMVITKKQAKLLYKSFKLDIQQAQKVSEKTLEADLMKVKA